MNNSDQKSILSKFLLGLGGTGIEQDEFINQPKMMQFEESNILKQAALGGQVSDTMEMSSFIDCQSSSSTHFC